MDVPPAVAVAAGKERRSRVRRRNWKPSVGTAAFEISCLIRHPPGGWAWQICQANAMQAIAPDEFRLGPDLSRCPAVHWRRGVWQHHYSGGIRDRDESTSPV